VEEATADVDVQSLFNAATVELDPAIAPYLARPIDGTCFDEVVELSQI
jgi:hypothetical protein